MNNYKHYYHCVLCIGFAVILWNSLKAADKQSIRPVALASTVFWSLHCGGKSKGVNALRILGAGPSPFLHNRFLPPLCL